MLPTTQHLLKNFKFLNLSSLVTVFAWRQGRPNPRLLRSKINHPVSYISEDSADKPMNCHPKLTVLVYSGEGAGEDSKRHFYNALTQVVDPEYHTIEYITPEEIKEGSWTKTCHVIAFGGGFDLGFIKAVGLEGTRTIRDFVHQGGAYLGICAGAYWACDYIEFDKDGPLQVVGERFLKFYPGNCIGPAFPGFQYNTKKGVHAVPVLYRGITSFKSYMHGGGYFAPPEKCGSTPIQKNSTGAGLNVSAEVPSSKKQSSSSISGFKADLACVSNISTANKLFSPSNDSSSKDNPHLMSDQPPPPEDNYLTDQARTGFDILGTFTSLSHCPGAVVRCQVGRGTAILSSVHLEFPVALLDRENPDLRRVLPQLQQSEPTRNAVFRDVLRQLRVRLKPLHPKL